MMTFHNTITMIAFHNTIPMMIFHNMKTMMTSHIHLKNLNKALNNSL